MCERCDGRFHGLTRRRLLGGLAAGFFAGGIPGEHSAAGERSFPRDNLAVFPPPDYDFEDIPDSIEIEWGGLEWFYQAYSTAMSGLSPSNAYGLAMACQVIGLLRGDPDYIVRAGGLYGLHRDSTVDAKQRKLADLGVRYCGYLLSGDYPKAAMDHEPVGEVVYDRKPSPDAGFKKIILGRSSIRVSRADLIKTQVDRVTRDWLMAYQPAGVPWRSASGKLYNSHEGARVTDIMRYSGASMKPVWGMMAKRIGNTWYAPDPTGEPRFEISPDKLREYASTIVVNDRTAIVNDTHGISALAWDALDATLVVGCGDHRGKMDAAYFLATKGVNVYVPTDRLIGTLIGVRTKGIIIGSAPVRQLAGNAVIGDQPVEIDIDETIVVSNGAQQYPLQYYDTPYRYFNALADYTRVPLKIRDVMIEEYGYGVPVVETARDLGANVIGMRVKSAKEHDAVAAWLAEDVRHRAVLFHTAAYADGYKLFAEFPKQTGFGDIHPQFA